MEGYLESRDMKINYMESPFNSFLDIFTYKNTKKSKLNKILMEEEELQRINKRFEPNKNVGNPFDNSYKLFN